MEQCDPEELSLGNEDGVSHLGTRSASVERVPFSHALIEKVGEIFAYHA